MKLILTSIYTTFFVLWPVLNTYSFFSQSIGLGDVIILPLSLFFLLKRWPMIWHNQKRHGYYTKFMGVMLLTSVYAYLYSYSSNAYGIVLSAARTLMYVLCFAIVAPNVIEEEEYLKKYKIVCVILAAVVYVQYVLYATMGYTQPFILDTELFEVREVDGYETYIAYWQAIIRNYGYKPPSLFTETAKTAQYIAPCLLLSLTSKKKKPTLGFELFVTSAVLLSFSANGAIYVIFCWFVWLLFYSGIGNKGQRFVLTGFVGVAALIYLFADSNNWLMVRLREIGTGLNSGSMRVLRGWLIYGQLPAFNKLFGVGLANVANYIRDYGITTSLDAGYVGYMSGLSEIAVAGGGISLLAFAFIFFKLTRTGNVRPVMMYGLMVLMIAASAILNNPTFGLLVAQTELIVIQHAKQLRRGAEMKKIPG